jgi:leucyl-tRNA synthetase
MELVNAATAFAAETTASATANPLAPDRPEGRALREALEALVLCLAPFAPHIAEELWQRLGGTGSIFRHRWPEYDPALAAAETITLVVQVNGKVRARLAARRGLEDAEAGALALADQRIAPLLAGKELRRVVVVPDRLVNLVVG